MSSEAAARLKKLELESSPLVTTARNNVNVNVAMNNQVGSDSKLKPALMSLYRRACFYMCLALEL